MIIPKEWSDAVGVYGIKHKLTNRWYVGSTMRCVKGRLKRHIYESKNKRLSCIGRALKEYGADAFDCEILARFTKPVTKEMEALIRSSEDMWIAKLKSAGINGFNVWSKSTGPLPGCEVCESTRQRLSAKMKGRIITPEMRALNSSAHMGIKHTPETRAKMSASRKGKKRAPEIFVKVVATRMSRGGYGHTDETKKKISEAKTGQPVTVTPARLAQLIDGVKHMNTPEANAKKSAYMKGMKMSPERIEKAASKRRGVPASEAVKANLLFYAKTNKQTPETKAKRTKTWRATMALKYPNGQPVSEETRAKLSAKNKGRKLPAAGVVKRVESRRINSLWRNADYVQFMWQLPYRLLLAAPQPQQCELL